MDPDWLMAEKGSFKGKVPTTYLEVLEWGYFMGFNNDC